MAKENAKKGTGKWIALLVSLLIIVGLVVTLVVFSNKKATAVMECNVNPNVQFVLDQNNKVMDVNYLNEDAEALFREVKFNGKSAEEAAEMFVSITTKVGKIDLSTEATGTTVQIKISCEKTEEFDEVKKKVTDTVNKYFAENGIIAGAVTEVKADLADAATKLGVKAKEVANKTTEEIMALYEETSKDLQEVAVSVRSEFFTAVDNLKTTTFAILDTLEEQITVAKQQISEWEKNVNDQVKPLIKEAKKALKELEKQFKEKKQEFEAKVDEIIAQLKQVSETAWNAAKETVKGWETAAKEIIENHKAAYQADKATIDAAVKAFQDSLAK